MEKRQSDELISKDKLVKFAIVLSLGTVLIQAAHSAYVFSFYSSFPTDYVAFGTTINLNMIHAVFYSVLISGAIFFFLLAQNKGVAVFFAIFEGLINIAYYVKFLMEKNMDFWNLTILIPISVVLPVTIYYYSEEINRLLKQDVKSKETRISAKEVVNEFKKEEHTMVVTRKEGYAKNMYDFKLVTNGTEDKSASSLDLRRAEITQ